MNPAIRQVLSIKPKRRVVAFAIVADQLSDKEYWRLAGHIWARYLTPMTPVYEYASLWHKILTSPRAHSEYFARHPVDRIRWIQMPDPFICYRGFGAKNRDGAFYSLDYDTSYMFKTMRHKRDGGGKIIGEVLFKSDCVFFGGIQEEVVYIPPLSRVVEVEVAQVEVEAAPVEAEQDIAELRLKLKETRKQIARAARMWSRRLSNGQ